MPDLKVPFPSEFSLPFVQGMSNRMATSFCKYGSVADAYPGTVSALASAQMRIEKYLATGNTEFLMDAGNFLMIEFMFPSVAGAHFEAGDSDQSPGRASVTGDKSALSNKDLNTLARLS